LIVTAQVVGSVGRRKWAAGAGEAPGKTAVDHDPMPQPKASLLSYPAAIPLSNRTLIELADLLRYERNQRRSRWRRLDAGR